MNVFAGQHQPCPRFHVLPLEYCDLPITCDEDAERSLIRLEAEVDIGSVAELKATLTEAIVSRKQVRLDCERATGLDIAVLQLLWATAREVERTGGPFWVAGQSREILIGAAREVGLDFVLPGSVDAAANHAEAATAERAE
jgi:anti-anti-sigma regulatory factor